MLERITHRTFFWIFVVILLSLPALYALTHPGFFVTDDGDWMIIRFSAFYQALRDGQFPVRFLHRLNFDYGYPVATFLYPGFMYFAVPFKVIGFDFVDSMKMVLALSLVGSAVFSFLWLVRLFPKIPAVVGALFYVYLPYHLYDVYTRGSVGEVFALLWVPFVLWMIERKSVFFVSLGIFLLLISHNTLALLFVPLLFLYALLRKVFLKKDLLISFFLGGLLSSFFTIPALLELSNTQFSKTVIADPLQYFASFEVIGLVSFFILLVSAVFYLRNMKKEEYKRIVLLFLILVGISVFLASSISTFVWQVIPSSFIQFPFRVLSVLLPSIAFLTAFLLYRIRESAKTYVLLLVLLGILLIINASPFLIPKEYTQKDEGYYVTNDATTTVQDEYMPLWVKDKVTQRPERKVEIIKGEGEVVGISSTNKQVVFSMNATAPTIVQINTIYWPGWKAFVDGKERQIERNEKGLMQLSLDAGEKNVVLTFEETPLRLFADILSISALVGLAGYVGKRIIS